MDRQWRRECDAECRGSAGTLLCGGFGGDNVRRGATDPLRTAEAAKAGDAVVAPKQEGARGFYRLAAQWSAPWSTGWLRSYLTEVIWSFSLSWVVDVAFPFSPSIHLSVAKVTSVFQTYILYQNPLSRGRVRFSQYAQNRLCAASRNKLDFVNGVPTAKIGCC